jgi:hypothetical protein
MNGKPSSPVLRGLGASNGARLLDPQRIMKGLPVIRGRSAIAQMLVVLFGVEVGLGRFVVRRMEVHDSAKFLDSDRTEKWTSLRMCELILRHRTNGGCATMSKKDTGRKPPLTPQCSGVCSSRQNRVLISDLLLTDDFERPTFVLVLLNRHDHSQTVVSNFASTMRPRNQVMLLIRQRAAKLSF